MKRILVTGALGQLGVALRRELATHPEFDVLYADVSAAADVLNLDIADSVAVSQCFSTFKPDVVINAAAYTAVDKAESEQLLCRRINADAPGILAEACAASDAMLVHISTDYVFNGNATHPYKETDTPDPRNVYGRTKLAGEESVRKLLPDKHLILRTAWLYSHTGRNFVKTMLSLAASHKEIGVVADQWGTPTYAPVLAQGIIAAISAKHCAPGTYHFTGTGRTTWYDFSRAIFREAGLETIRVRALTSDEYPTAARRPPYSVLDCSKFSRTFAFEIPDWQESLHEFFHDFD